MWASGFGERVRVYIVDHSKGRGAAGPTSHTPVYKRAGKRREEDNQLDKSPTLVATPIFRTPPTPI